MSKKLKVELKNGLMTVLNDYHVQRNGDLNLLFEKCMAELENAKTNRDVSAIAARLSQSISLYLVCHRYEAPKSVIDLGLWLAKYPSVERGHLAPLQMLAQSLAGLLR